MKINITSIRRDPEFISHKVLLMSVVFHVSLFVVVGFMELI